MDRKLRVEQHTGSRPCHGICREVRVSPNAARRLMGTLRTAGSLMRLQLVLLSALLTCAACSHSSPPAPPADDAAVRNAIEAEIAKSVEATRTQNIETYMECIPEDWVMQGENGERVTRDQLRANVLRDWGIIPHTLAIETKVDSLQVHGDAATVYTSQRWERLMLQRDGKTRDTVLTTQKHRETWRKTPRGWMAFEIEELGGEVWVNGKPYQP